jgi:hypothetical protein
MPVMLTHCAAIAALCVGLAACGAAQAAGSREPAESGTPRRSVSAPLTAEQIAACMHLRQVTAYTAATDPNHLLGRQGGYTSKVNWRPGLSSIEVYPDASGAQTRLRYMQALQGTIVGDGYDYRDGGALLRLDRRYTPTQAHKLDVRFRTCQP